MGEPRCLTLGGSLDEQVRVLWRSQSRQWPMLREGIDHLRAAETRRFDVGGAQVVAQCNTARIRSAAAQVDPTSLRERPCFLCEANLPPEQQAIAYAGCWLILCNPMPIFEPHLVLVTRDHQPQRLEPALDTLLTLARDLAGSFTVFYNGPQCGASAPDHLHLQASPAGAMPFENELAGALCAERHSVTNHRWIDRLWTEPVQLGLGWSGYRPVVVMIGEQADALRAGLSRVLDALAQVQPADPEPMVNLFATFNANRWLIWLFPRRAHRPSCYGQEADCFLVSPGAADLGGLLMTPRPADFKRIDAATIETIYREILLTPDQFAALRDHLSA